MNTSMSGDGNQVTITLRAPRMDTHRLITGAPYSAEEISEHTQTLSDGTHITQNQTVRHLFRDSQGRTRFEQPATIGMGMIVGEGQKPYIPMLVEIFDPIAGSSYVLDDQNKVAHRISLTPPNAQEAQGRAMSAAGTAGRGGSPALPAAPPPTQRTQTNVEQLGTQSIEGVIAQGTRRTTTIPIGAQGNDRPMTNTFETWYSQELQMTVLSKSSSVRNGDSVTKLINISRAEPDSSLFLPPPDYTIQEDTDVVKLTFKRPQ